MHLWVSPSSTRISLSSGNSVISRSSPPSHSQRQLAQNPAAAIAGEWFTAHGRDVDLGYIEKEENHRIADRLKEAFSAWLNNGHVDMQDESPCRGR